MWQDWNTFNFIRWKAEDWGGIWFKCLNFLIKLIDEIPIDSLFNTDSTNTTRNSKGKIFIKHCSTNLRKYSFSHRIAPYWNLLNSNIKFSDNINMFKNSLDGDPKLLELFYEFDK